jgi:predicted nuclease of predicted toxin-antitoxin system
MDHALAYDLIVLTPDLDFGAILAASRAAGPSVIPGRAMNLSPDSLAGPVAMILSQCAEPLHHGALVTPDAARMRVRLLPMGQSIFLPDPLAAAANLT